MSKHTPGPWVVDAHKNVMANGGLVAFPGISAGFDQGANARLIAAAPDLLDVVKELQESASYWSEYEVPLGIVERINAAIAKATGKTE